MCRFMYVTEVPISLMVILSFVEIVIVEIGILFCTVNLNVLVSKYYQ